MAYRRYFNVLKDDRHKTEKAGQQPGIDEPRVYVVLKQLSESNNFFYFSKSF
jgi:hypothetical protein